jgi:diaminopimelate epimerase
MTIVLPGGELEVEWEGSLDRRVPVYLTGPAVKSFDGEVEVGDLISS